MDKSAQKVLFSSVKPDYGTPRWLYDLLNREFTFVLDVAAQEDELSEEFALRRPREIAAYAAQLRKKNKLGPNAALFGEAQSTLLAFARDLVPRRANYKCPRYFTEKTNAFDWKWGGDGAWFLNPPYGRGIGRWMAECKKQAQMNPVLNPAGSVGVALVPARTDTKWFWDYCLDGASEVRLLKGRLIFEGGLQCSAPFPSALIVYRPFSTVRQQAQIIPWNPREAEGHIETVEE